MAADVGASLAFVKASQSCVITAPLEEAWAAVRECGARRCGSAFQPLRQQSVLAGAVVPPRH